VVSATTFTGVVSMAVIDTKQKGSFVRVYAPGDWFGRWRNPAKECL
jgi:hypothetical protein